MISLTKVAKSKRFLLKIGYKRYHLSYAECGNLFVDLMAALDLVAASVGPSNGKKKRKDK